MLPALHRQKSPQGSHLQALLDPSLYLGVSVEKHMKLEQQFFMLYSQGGFLGTDMPHHCWSPSQVKGYSKLLENSLDIYFYPTISIFLEACLCRQLFVLQGRHSAFPSYLYL